jgi:hypothetical protein
VWGNQVIKPFFLIISFNLHLLKLGGGGVEQLLRKKKRKTMGGGAFENKIIAYTRWISHHDIAYTRL